MKNLKYADAEHQTVQGEINEQVFFWPANDLFNSQCAEMKEKKLTPDDYVAPAATMRKIRTKRNQLLRDTDWQGMSDVTMSDAQTAYRKKLRDLPATNADPTKIVFPDAP